MQRALNRAALVVLMAGLCLGSYAARADDPVSDGPPGGNPVLSFGNDSATTPITKTTCTGGGNCIDMLACYTQNVQSGSTTYKSWKWLQYATFGNCDGTPIGDSNPTCTQYKTIKCADVRLYLSADCTGFASGITVPLYKVDACVP